MERKTDRKIVLVLRKTRIDELITRFNTLEQAKFYVEHLGGDFGDYVAEHDCYRKAAADAESALQRIGLVQVVDRGFIPTYVFGADDTVVVLGQDGLVANTLKYAAAQPVIGINPDPARWDGALLPFQVDDLAQIVPEVLAGRRQLSRVTMACAELADGQTLQAVNDLFIGARTHVSARYLLDVGGAREFQSSSGIIVSTGLGSTGWLSSILAGAAGIAGALSGGGPSVRRRGTFAWDADYLYYSVREPFPSQTTGTSLVFGKVSAAVPLQIESQMAGNGVIFSDGLEQDYLEFNAGMKARITVADEVGHLVG